MEINRVGWVQLCLSFLSLLSGCVSLTGELTEQPPVWIAKVPTSNSELCAVGLSGPTYYQEDARTYSKASAMTELARALEVTVKSQMTIRTSGDSRESDTAIQEIAGFTSEVVLKQSYVREQWVQPGGDSRYGGKGSVYTLICVRIPVR